MTQALTLHAGDAAATLLPAVGGALARFTWRARDVLRPMSDDAIASGNVRLAASYPLVPYSNRIRDAELEVADQRHRLARNFGESPHAIHGVGWQREWSVADACATGATLASSHAATTHDVPAWPWPFAATQRVTLTCTTGHATLALTLTLANTGMQSFPFGLGWHPFFPHRAASTLAFGACGVWHNDPPGIPLAHASVPDEWNFAARRSLGDVVLDNLFTGWDGRAVLETPGELRTTIEADSACRCLIVYAPPDSDFVAIEPVTHETDAFNRAARGAPDTGTRWLAPGSAFSCTMRITATSAMSS